jgi:hypothetical protein
MFADALRDGLVTVNVFAQLRLPRSRGRKDIVALTEAEVTALAELALNPLMELEDSTRVPRDGVVGGLRRYATGRDVRVAARRH